MTVSVIKLIDPLGVLQGHSEYLHSQILTYCENRFQFNVTDQHTTAVSTCWVSSKNCKTDGVLCVCKVDKGNLTETITPSPNNPSCH